MARAVGFYHRAFGIDVNYGTTGYDGDEKVRAFACIRRPMTREQRQRLGNDQDRCGMGQGRTVTAATRMALEDLIATHLRRG